MRTPPRAIRLRPSASTGSRFKSRVVSLCCQRDASASWSVNVVEQLLVRLLPAVGLKDALPDHWASGTALSELEATRAQSPDAAEPLAA